MLRPVVEPMLAQAVDTLPGTAALRRVAFEVKWDGFRALLFTGTRAGGPVLLQSRRGNLFQGAFPDLVTAANEQLPQALVLDGELVVWNGTELSFAAVQRRAVSGTRHARQLAVALPAYFVAFDILQADGEATVNRPYLERRNLLETLFAERALTAPWTLCPMTRDPDIAKEWLRDWTLIPGLEGVVLKPVGGRYTPGRRGWTKLRRRDTTEAIIGAVTGTLARPQQLLLGRYDDHGRLRTIGRTTALRPDAARQLAGHLTPADPEHPWTGVTFTSTWGSREPLHPLLVTPGLVAEISADTAVDRGGMYRHPLRFVRIRLDMPADDVPAF
ncbi:ATP-dependent DNA ligase [Streptomyces sp. NPDC058595]|uniref:ATP-dependent DNA ligase n=1 Tax=Streptomyces sp. NPDC058595 TaxID=3346550 RepID=UPI003664F426